MVDSFLAAGTLCVIWLAAFGLGQACLAWFPRNQGVPFLEQLLWPTGLGFLIGTLVIGLLGTLGIASKLVVSLGTLGAAAFGLVSLAWMLSEALVVKCRKAELSPPVWRGGVAQDHFADFVPRPGAQSGLELPAADVPRGIHCLMSLKEIGRWLAQSVGPGLPRGLKQVIALGAVETAASSFFMALAPPTAEEAVTYHLAWIRSWQLAERIRLVPWWWGEKGPGLADVVFFWGLQIGDLCQPALLTWGFGLVLAAATAVFASCWTGREWGRIAGAVVLLIPVVHSRMGIPSPEVISAAWGGLALAAVVRGVCERQARWFLIASLFAGGCALVLPSGIFVAVGVVAGLAYSLIRKFPKSQLLPVGGIGGVVVACIMIVLMQAGFRANFLAQGAKQTSVQYSELNPAEAELVLRTLGDEVPPDGTASNRPGWAVYHHWGRNRPDQGVIGQHFQDLGLLFPAVLPAILWYGIPKGLGWWFAGGAVSWVIIGKFWSGSSSELFLLPILATLIVSVWRQRTSDSPRWDRLVDILLLGILTTYLFVAVHRSAKFWPVAVGWEPREAFLDRFEPTWKAAELLGLWPAGNVRLLTNETRRGYFPCPVIGEEEFCSESLSTLLEQSPEQLLKFVRQHQVTHLLIREFVGSSETLTSPMLVRIVDACRGLASDRLVLLTDYRVPSPSWGSIRYRLYLIL
jgi:hypothetical protein